MTPLSSTLRERLVWILGLVFIVGTPILIGYSQGYRLGDAMSLIHTGGIYLYSDLSKTSVYLDGEFVQSRGYFIRNIYLQNLRSNKTYEVWVVRDGYQSWMKDMAVYPKLVTEARPLMLPALFEWSEVSPTLILPLAEATSTRATSTKVANPAYTDLEELFAKKTEQFVVEVATSTLVTVKGKQVSTTTTLYEAKFPHWLEDIASSTDLAEKQNVRERDGVLVWLDEGNIHAVWARENEVPPYYFCTATCTPKYIIDWGEDVTHVEFYPNRSDVLIVGSDRGVYAVELDGRTQRNIQPFIEENGLTFRLQQNNILTIFDGTLFRETSW